MSKLTMDRALDLLQQAVDQKGEDYVYQWCYGPSGKGCYNVIGGQPSCIVGHVLVNSGLFEIDDLDGNANSIRGISGDYLGYFSQRAVAVLSAAQDAQDEGKTWGEALRKAQEAAGLLVTSS